MSRFLLAALVLVTSACTNHIRPYTPKVRNYKPDRYASSADQHADGSLFNESSDTLFTHRRSSRIGDLVTVVVAESAAANDDAATEAGRSSELSFGVNSFFNAMTALKAAHPGIDPTKLISAMAKNDFNGKGATRRSGRLTATITSRIKRVLPNGDYYIEGHKALLLNEEESHLYVSGVVRPSDIQADNSVLSSVIADAQVEYTGRGPVADKQKPGWFSRFLDWIWPF
ncbi:MAG: flagellar basal body L-ring protein FlgH [Deltaproteobacteria bacterium]|nr:flagellar basal body L-ring protein FlgH [Deltaproteobacteria bacterium]